MATEAQIAHCRRIAQSGGFATLERYGVEHMRRIGRIGYAVVKDKYGSGEAQRVIRGKGWSRQQVSTFEQDREIWS